MKLSDKDCKIMKYIIILLEILTPYERRRLLLLISMIFVMAFFDMLGVASIMPFIAVLANPKVLETNSILRAVYEFAKITGIKTPSQFLIALGFFVFALLIFSLLFKAITTYAQTRFSLMREYTIGRRLIEGYLNQPYCWFLNRHSSSLGKNILSEVGTVINQAMQPMMVLIAQGAIAIALLILLLIVDYLLAISIGTVLVAAYASIFILMSNWLKRLGQESVTANLDRFTVVSEAFAAIKEVKIGGLEQTYVGRFIQPAKAYAKVQATSQIISQVPRFGLEIIAFGGMLLVVLYLMAKTSNFIGILPLIALYAFAGYRLMPALQQIYWAASQLRFASAAVESLHKDLINIRSDYSEDHVDACLSLNKAISLNNILYSYPNASQPTIKGLTFRIPARSTIGIVGATGSGKTTIVDIVLGLLEPQEGTLSVDDQVITASNLRQWQKAIGYVPQQIFLADESISANIAFGVNHMDVNQAQIENVARISELHDFVVNELPEGYKTKIGERGVRLSGGQRQRIGIARALYNNPKVLIMDEATSALDGITEKAVMDAVSNLGGSMAIVLIAHRLNTVKNCNNIIFMDNGIIKAIGTYEELIQNCEQFAAMSMRS
jgi:ABC-type bacteriocin/lantibiotic exporter with double-glycine peptidase domain